MRVAAGWLSGGSVLDAGCNIADLVRFLPANVDYVGLEALSAVVELVRGRYPDRRFEAADLEAPWPAAVAARRFGHVALLAVLEHLRDPVAVLVRAREVLEEGGTIVVTTPHPRARLPHELGARLRVFSRDATSEHVAFYDRVALSRMARAAGLVVVHYATFQLRMNQLAVMAPPVTGPP